MSFLHVVMGRVVCPWLFPCYDSASLSTVSTVCRCSSVLTGVSGGQSLQAMVHLLHPLVHGPVLALNQHQLMPDPVCTISPGVSPGQGCLPTWLAASAPSSPLQTPVTHAATTQPPLSLQPNPGAPWHSGFFAICNGKRIEMKQRTSGILKIHRVYYFDTKQLTRLGSPVESNTESQH